MSFLKEKVAIIVTDANRLIIWVNEAFTNMTGYSFIDVRGKKPSLLQGKHSEKAAIKRIRHALNEEISFHDRITNYRKNGQEYTCALTIHPIFDFKGQLTNFIAFEIDNNFISPQQVPIMQISEKYQTSNLSEAEELSIFFRLIDYFREKKPYLNPNLTQSEVAHMIDTNVKYLSQVINNQTEKNFRYFVNQFRVQEFEHFLTNREMSNLTLFAIAEKCGFQNKSTFHKAIYKHTGATPRNLAQKYIN